MRTALPFVLMLAACQTAPGHPPMEEIAAITESKPKPGVDILTDPTADARYNSAVEGWGDRLHAAGMRLCRFYERTGMPNIDCGK